MDVLDNFMRGNVHILIASDLIGIHGVNVGLVLFVDLPIRCSEAALNLDVFMRKVGRCTKGMVMGLIKSDNDLLYKVCQQLEEKGVSAEFI